MKGSCVFLVSWILVGFLLILHFGIAVEEDVGAAKCSCDEAHINRQGFPNGFKFGSASSAYQIEGGFDENGKGPGLWDHYTHTCPDKILDKTNGDVAVDSYHMYKDDVQLLKNMGVDVYKFSISWPRILPGGSISKGVNRNGIDYYNALINELLANGIEPWVTMFHLDTPHALEDSYGGFLSNQIVGDFEDFAELLFNEFGDRVKYWITINEPWALSILGYAWGVFAPGRCSQETCVAGNSTVEPYIVTHNQLLVHARIVNLYRNKYQDLQKGKIGITVNSYWLVPYDDQDENIRATQRALDFMLGWVLEPLTFGTYPLIMQERVGSRLPKFTEEEIELLKGSFDFIGLNYYMSNYVRDAPANSSTSMSLVDSGTILTGVKDGVPIGPRGSSIRYYYSYPKGLREILRYMKEKYDDPLIYITENGHDEDNNLTMSLAIQDYKRKDYFLDHLCCLREAIMKDGANVKGYFTWSLVDNFEFTSGYLVRFGLHYVDFKDKLLRRYPKYSALWFKSILARRDEDSESKGIADQ